ncbi:MAG: hypothetical protein CFH22_00146 [Alphaproteobacteria bacterium MarineAlpha5_Bin12]|nr:MAG: hypothetical protein CFH22_00146 [Alphaproteobacteria bacterium MarineAlpha5_Bin12]|tara:strand:+ start:7821 stop:9485 length:1665 start_codon:yes stop_codon:yes gene_type:complete
MKSKEIMTLKRMGSKYPSRLSFSRSMLRLLVREKWKIRKSKFDLDKNGYGTVIYEVDTLKGIYSLICFSRFLNDEERSDRVIADKWDTAYTLHIGKISKKNLNRLKENVPLQELGRNSPNEIILSRANKSVRLFKKVVECLSNGEQPSIKEINEVGYLMRTTAVYGSGKFGLSDFERTKKATLFDQPFRAEMLSVYIIREFSVDLVEHIAHHINPKKAVKLDKKIKQHLGIGNSTGLGMAPFVIKHPKLIHKWMNQFNLAVNKIYSLKNINQKKLNEFIKLIEKSKDYLKEVKTVDSFQIKKNAKALADIKKTIIFLKKNNPKKNNYQWKNIIDFAYKNLNYDAQEIIKVQLIELYPEIADPLGDDMSNSDDLYIKSNEKISSLIEFIEKNYQWAIKIDFNKKENSYLFWYISEEKLEPRLGERYNEKGSELEQPLGIGKLVQILYNFLLQHKETHKETVAKFLLSYPEYRGIIRRIQTLSDYKFGEVKDNILAKNTMPIDMLRFKLSFFGASRYDPKSDRWLRVSFFAGAPFYRDLSNKNVDTWGFTTMNSYN